MKDKSIEIKRVLIFCLIAFAPLCIITPILNSIFDEKIFAAASEKALAAAYALGALGMFSPAIANILTRLITKEGFAESYLAANVKGNVRYYIASVAVKLAENAVTVLLICLVLLNNLKLSEAFSTKNLSQNLATIIMQIGFSIILFFPAFGEEFGWRGYLMPKLIKLMGKPAAIFVGGIIWGLWHAPLTISGHNFGTDYKHYPYLGILIMCIICICFNAFLTLVTEKTKSVYPASLYHMINNNLNTTLILSLFGTQQALVKFSEISTVSVFLISLPATAVVTLLSLALFLKKEKSQTQ